MKHIFNIAMRQDTCKSFCCKLGVMLNTTELYSLIPVQMTSVLTQGHRVTGKLDPVQSFCCKVAGRNSNVHDS